MHFFELHCTSSYGSNPRISLAIHGSALSSEYRARESGDEQSAAETFINVTANPDVLLYGEYLIITTKR